MTEATIYDALKSKAGYEVVRSGCTADQLRVVGRVSPAQTANWLEVVRELLAAAQAAPWDVDVSKHYFCVAGTELRYAWRLIFQAEAIEQYFEAIAAAAMATQPVSVPQTEIPLHATANRNQPVRGKGAQPIGKAVVGPAAAMQLKMGG